MRCISLTVLFRYSRITDSSRDLVASFRVVNFSWLNFVLETTEYLVIEFIDGNSFVPFWKLRDE